MIQAAGLLIGSIVGGEIGPKEEGRRRRCGITSEDPGDPDQSLAARVDLAIAHQGTSRLIGRERSHALGSAHPTELHRCLGVAAQTGERSGVVEAIFALSQIPGPGKAGCRPTHPSRLHRGASDDQLLGGCQGSKSAVQERDSLASGGGTDPLTE